MKIVVLTLHKEFPYECKFCTNKFTSKDSIMSQSLKNIFFNSYFMKNSKHFTKIHGILYKIWWIFIFFYFIFGFLVYPPPFKGAPCLFFMSVFLTM